MAEQQYFREALSDFVSETAYAGAVRHLYDLGYPVEKIQSSLSYPVSEEKIRRVIEAYEEKKQHPDTDYEYVQDTDAYGKKSFRRVKKQTKNRKTTD